MRPITSSNGAADSNKKHADDDSVFFGDREKTESSVTNLSGNHPHNFLSNFQGLLGGVAVDDGLCTFAHGVDEELQFVLEGIVILRT